MENNVITDDDVDENPEIKEIKNCAGYENISDEEALKISEDLKELSIIFYNAFERSCK